MANTKQAKKMIRKISRRTSYNQMWKKRIKSIVKTLDNLIALENPQRDEIEKNVRILQKTVDKAAKSGVVHKNKANRIKSRKIAKANEAKNKQTKRTKKGAEKS